ncbi:MAG: alpha/beta hydrolase [Acidimicrobiales bacterium]|nr:alpha/beta hydrolase [Acidimicrobiales bacterium]
MTVQHRIIELGEVWVEITEAGAGGIPLLLLHGFTGSREDFADWFEKLADAGWHVVAPDHRGHGGSAKPDKEEAYSLATLAADALVLADQLGWEEFVVLGHSMGGMVAQLIAIDAPERVAALVLMDTAHGPLPLDHEQVALGARAARERGMEWLAAYFAANPSPLATEADERVRRERPGYVEFGERKFLASSPAMYAALLHELAYQQDRLRRLAEVTVPTLVLVGEQDAMFIPFAQRIAATMPASRLEVIPGAGHSPQFEAPDKWWEILSAFLNELRECAADRKSAEDGAEQEEVSS